MTVAAALGVARGDRPRRDGAAVGGVRLRTRRRAAAVGGRRSPRCRDRRLDAGHLHQHLPGVDRAARHRPRRRRTHARRGGDRHADRAARVPAGERSAPRRGDRHRRARRGRRHRPWPRPPPRRAGARRRWRRGLRCADDVGRCQRPAARVRPAGASLRPAAVPRHDHHGLRRARHRQRRRVRGDREVRS